MDTYIEVPIFEKDIGSSDIPIIDKLKRTVSLKEKSSSKILKSVSRLTSSLHPSSREQLLIQDPANFIHKLMFSSKLIEKESELGKLINRTASRLPEEDIREFFLLLVNNPPPLGGDARFFNIEFILDTMLYNIETDEALEEMLNLVSDDGERSLRQVIGDYRRDTFLAIQFKTLFGVDFDFSEDDYSQYHPARPELLFKNVPREYWYDLIITRNNLYSPSGIIIKKDMKRDGLLFQTAIKYGDIKLFQDHFYDLRNYLKEYDGLTELRLCLKKKEWGILKLLFENGLSVSDEMIVEFGDEIEITTPALEAVRADDLVAAKMILFWKGFHTVEDIDLFSEVRSKDMKELLLYWAEDF